MLDTTIRACDRVWLTYLPRVQFLGALQTLEENKQLSTFQRWQAKGTAFGMRFVPWFKYAAIVAVASKLLCCTCYLGRVFEHR